MNKFAICNLSVIPLRAEASDRSEIVSQVLFGEHFEILEKDRQWSKIRLQFDQYEGWVDSKQYQEISKENYDKLSNDAVILNADLVEYAITPENHLTPLTLGASLSFLHHPEINSANYNFEGLKVSGIKPKNELIATAYMYLNAPYLWGGKTPFGIDCSGFTQMVYKLNGHSLLRDASQQATQGEVLSFIEESEPGDLAFFDNEEGKIIHVGIMLENNYIIHASGKVRIDRLDHLGIYNAEQNRHTHRLRVIKKII
ncbi:C40 family peptidase [Flavobacterium sp. N1719]|uniref:C40 family peptidase n=1 Tax=Flavobacterium sp. N1719 TaxID=2885633 RepID=UPI002223DBE4|nr:C40 family peptidase [Flavobacterium sp. N1719]